VAAALFGLNPSLATGGQDEQGAWFGRCSSDIARDFRHSIVVLFSGQAAESLASGTPYVFEAWRADASLAAGLLTNAGFEFESEAYCRAWARLEAEAMALMVRYRHSVARVASALLARGTLREHEIAWALRPRVYAWTAAGA
jgi:hypothetical protein